MPTTLTADRPTFTGPPETAEDREQQTQSLLTRLSHAEDEQERARLSDEIVLVNMHVAESIAGRYRRRGAELDDLVQVARLGLVKAVERFDVERGGHFLAFAVPTITGEVKRYFRDHCWDIRPPRRVQEVQHAIASAEPELTQHLGRAPTSAELAEELGADRQHVEEALASDGFFHVISLDMPAGWDESSRTIAEEVGEDDWHLRWVENHESLAPVLARLTDREKRLLYLRFEKGWKQSEIATDFGISQMQVSRLLSRLLTRLRDQLQQADDEGRVEGVGAQAP